MKELDLYKLPLDNSSMIEAAAGTGKTWTICALFLRLLLEKEIPLREILVLTFTEAATAELQSRIREELLSMRGHLQNKNANPGFAEELLSKLDHSKASKLIDLALCQFDESSIHTIHGFANRILSENAFACGLSLKAELDTDLSDLRAEMAADFLRLLLPELSSNLTRYLAGKRFQKFSLLDPAAWQKLMSLSNSACILQGAEKLPELKSIENELNLAKAEVLESWNENSGEEIVTHLLAQNLDGRKYQRKNLDNWIKQIHHWILSGFDPADTPKYLVRFTHTFVTSCVKGDFVPDLNPLDKLNNLYHAILRLEEVYEQWIRYQYRQAAEFFAKEFYSRKREAHKYDYDDLLGLLHQALCGSDSAGLLGTIRSRYKAALIDEFQDTDPVQWAIFNKIYSGTGQALILVGDPKQAIYGFRGADIFTYLDSRKTLADRVSTLQKNWRSASKLVNAVNHIFDPDRFDKSFGPFFNNNISHHAISAARDPEEILVCTKDPELSKRPFIVWDLGLSSTGKNLSKGAASHKAAIATAREIETLLKKADKKSIYFFENANGDQRKISGGDIAVLVRTHRQADLIVTALSQKGIKSVSQSTASIYSSEAAEELTRVLSAILHPENTRLMRAALSTTIYGYSLDSIIHLKADSPDITTLQQSFSAFQVTWQKFGIGRMLRELIRKTSYVSRVSGLRNGERAITNMYHLCENLELFSRSNNCSMEQLLVFLATESRNEAVDNIELRLESDQNLVKIVTIHKCKGLQYPIVFAPFLWSSTQSISEKEPLKYYDQIHSTRVLDYSLQNAAAAKDSVVGETLAESIRQTYVALTRSVNRTYLISGITGKKDSLPSSLDWLVFSQGSEIQSANSLHQITSDLSSVDRDRQLLKFCADPAISLQEFPPDDPNNDAGIDTVSHGSLVSREATRLVEKNWFISSYSGLTSLGWEAEHSAKDPEEFLANANYPMQLIHPAASNTVSLHTFPTGPVVGQVFHDVLESIDFTRCDDFEYTNALCFEKLQTHGFSSDLADSLAKGIQNIIHSKLSVDSELCLFDLSISERLNEMEFHFDCIGVSSDDLFSEAERSYSSAISSEQSSILNMLERYKFDLRPGFVKGFVDLIFMHGGRYHIVDYKSNYLGADFDSYTEDAIVIEMGHASYYMQAWIYSLALHRFLSHRLKNYDPNRNLGSVYYLFLRGMQPEHPGSGVYHRLIDPSMVKSLDKHLRYRCV
jgi:exodeoxyribonuclease V beta subunit